MNEQGLQRSTTVTCLSVETPMTKEAYECGKRGLGLWQTSPMHAVAKEPYACGKRARCMCLAAETPRSMTAFDDDVT